MKKGISPYIVIILSFIIIISIGTLLLLLPISIKNPIAFIDALFTSTSAVCVTGLLSVPTVSGQFTLFGKIIILLLIEIGGLGFVTITIFIFTILGMKIGISNRFLIKESLNQKSLKGMVRLVRFAVLTTLCVQFIGAIINFFIFKNYYNFWDAIGISIFHSISSFNNAGFDLFNSGTSMVPFADNIYLNINTSLLVICGGIGFITIYDVVKNFRKNPLSIHTHIVLKTSLLLIIIGMVLLKISEGDKITWLQAFFNSVSSRTAGFSTVNYSNFSNAGLLTIMILMYIGASPSSTGGGIKTTTFYVSIKYLLPLATGKKAIIKNRKIANESFIKAFVLIVVSLLYIAGIIFLINLIENNNFNTINHFDYFIKIVFEVFSAFGTVGNSMGITGSLQSLSKLLIIITMIVGRIGPITIISALYRYQKLNVDNEINYLEEKIIIG